MRNSVLLNSTVKQIAILTIEESISKLEHRIKDRIESNERVKKYSDELKKDVGYNYERNLKEIEKLKDTLEALYLKLAYIRGVQ